MYLDFGFLAARPRIHELAYSLAFMLLALKEVNGPAPGAWQGVPRLIDAYESSVAAPLSVLEREALTAYTAAVPLYFAALAGFNKDPIRELHAYLPFLRLSEWLLALPDARRRS